MTDDKKVADKKDAVPDRVKAFVEDYGKLVEKHQIDYATYPVFVPDGQQGFRVIIQNTPVDISKQPKKSPFVAPEK